MSENDEVYIDNILYFVCLYNYIFQYSTFVEQIFVFGFTCTGICLVFFSQIIVVGVFYRLKIELTI